MAQADENTQSSTQWGTRLPEDVNKEVKQFKEQNGLSKSETLRRLVQLGLDKSTPAQQWVHDMRQLGNHLVAIGFVAFMITMFWPTGSLAAAGTLMTSFATTALLAFLVSKYVENTYT